LKFILFREIVENTDFCSVSDDALQTFTDFEDYLQFMTHWQMLQRKYRFRYKQQDWKNA